MWDMSLAAMVPGLRLAAPRDAATLAEELAEALRVADGPTLLRFPKGAVPASVPAVRRLRLTPVDSEHLSGHQVTGAMVTGGVDMLAEPRGRPGQRCAARRVGAFGGLAVEAAGLLAAQGIGVTVIDPRWALPVPPEIAVVAARHRLVVTVEDGGRSGGVGAAITDALSGTGIPVQVLALPQQFLEPAPAPSCSATWVDRAGGRPRHHRGDRPCTARTATGPSASRMAGDREPGTTG